MARINRAIGIIMLVLAVFVAKSQPPVPDMRTCAAVEQDSLNRIKYPGWNSLDEMEPAIFQKIQEIERNQIAGRTEVVVTIPVIFHIVHNGESIGSGHNLAPERIQTQLEVLNEDFRRQFGTNGYNDNPDGADIEIEFCLASIDEQGNPMQEPGIHRYNSGASSWSRLEIEGQVKPLTIWNPNLYYNIWTVNFSGADDLLLGYAQFPSQSGLTGLPGSGGPSSTDGVVLRYDVVGSAEKGDFPQMQAPYNKGRTLTHETGHWLGLRHIWGDGPCGADDFCDDTPEAAGPNRGCPQGSSSCGSVDMIENYMDYSNDACMNIFTKDQKARILAVLELSPRRGILTSSMVCGTINQDPPVANFVADKTSILLGGTVKFNDLSTNFPTNWTWNFEGGNPEVSTERNPSVTYDTPGTYKVNLISSNANGSSPVFELENYISVSSEGLCNSLSNFGNGTESLLRVPSIGDSTGFIAGHNSMGDLAKSEFFLNELGYAELSGALMKFAFAYSEDEDAVAKIVVWNARGPQNAPGAILEQKDILIRQIKEDIEANRPTTINFERRVPIFLGTPFHIGVLLDYNGDSLALSTTADGESTTQTSWEQNSEGEWIPYSLAWGIDVAHDITALVGMKPSVNVSASSESIYSSQSVTLTAGGASIFSWDSDDGMVNGQLGPQITVSPRSTTTYTVTGSGLDLCLDEASITIFVKEPPLSVNDLSGLEINLYPNPVIDNLNIILRGEQKGLVNISLLNSIGIAVVSDTFYKASEAISHQLGTRFLAPGIYILNIEIEGESMRRRLMIR